MKRAAKTGNKEAQKEEAVLLQIKEALEAGISVRAIEIAADIRSEFVTPLQLITDKPVLYVCNVDEESAVSGNAYVDKVKDVVANENAEVIVLAVGTEADITELETFEERQMFLDDLGLDEPGSAKLIRAAYNLLKLQTYFTAGVKEAGKLAIEGKEYSVKDGDVMHFRFNV